MNGHNVLIKVVSSTHVGLITLYIPGDVLISLKHVINISGPAMDPYGTLVCITPILDVTLVPVCYCLFALFK